MPKASINLGGFGGLPLGISPSPRNWGISGLRANLKQLISRSCRLGSRAAGLGVESGRVRPRRARGNNAETACGGAPTSPGNASPSPPSRPGQARQINPKEHGMSDRLAHLRRAATRILKGEEKTRGKEG